MIHLETAIRLAKELLADIKPDTLSSLRQMLRYEKLQKIISLLEQPNENT